MQGRPANLRPGDAGKNVAGVVCVRHSFAERAVTRAGDVLAQCVRYFVLAVVLSTVSYEPMSPEQILICR